jgi:hypothetical protein
MVHVRPVLIWRDPEALLAWVNGRYGMFRDPSWDLRDQSNVRGFTRVVQADPRNEPDYHWLRIYGLGNAQFAAGIVSLGLAVLEHLLPWLAPASDAFLVVMFGMFFLTMWRVAAYMLVKHRVRLPRWLVASSWAQWAVVLTLCAATAVTVRG